MDSTVQSRHLVRVIFESIAKMTILGGLVFNAVVHFYILGILNGNGLLPELIMSMFILDIFLLGGALAFIIISEVSQRGTMMEWVAYFSALLVVTFLVITQLEYFKVFDSEGLTFMRVPAIFTITWIGLMLVSIGYMFISGPIMLVRSFMKKYRLKINPSTAHKVRTALMAILPLLSMTLAIPAMNWFIAEGTVKRTVVYQDNNMDANLAMWNYPKFDVQVNDTQEIDLGKLASNETDVLTAFGRMNTTFYFQIHFDTPEKANETIARLKMLDAFNCTVCCTIWYSENVSDYLEDLTGKSFPGPHFAEDWIANARATMEFVIANNITNVIGICSDSEATYIGDTVEGYQESLATYDAFLQEVQTNVSLKNPRPGQETFETVLCTGPRGIMDMLDGDQDVYANRRIWGLWPFSWTKYHFMLYRGPPTANTAVLYEYLLMMKEFLGTEDAAPIVGLTGTLWFAEGYYNGTAENFDRDEQQYQYDGIDGWEAMKREILIGKAMGFDTVSVFHLNKYGDDPTVWENYGMLDYYGVDAIEELADEWNQVNNTVEYPISSLACEISTRGMFSPHDELVYDIIQNTGMQVFQVVLFVLIGAVLAWNVKRNQQRHRDEKKKVKSKGRE